MTMVSAITCAQSLGARVSACERIVWERLAFARGLAIGGAGTLRDLLGWSRRSCGLVGFLEETEQTAPARLGLDVTIGCRGIPFAGILAALDVAQRHRMIGVP